MCGATHGIGLSSASASGHSPPPVYFSMGRRKHTARITSYPQSTKTPRLAESTYGEHVQWTACMGGFAWRTALSHCPSVAESTKAVAAEAAREFAGGATADDACAPLLIKLRRCAVYLDEDELGGVMAVMGDLHGEEEEAGYQPSTNVSTRDECIRVLLELGAPPVPTSPAVCRVIRHVFLMARKQEPELESEQESEPEPEPVQEPEPEPVQEQEQDD
jgi:hypothetical protein